MTPENLPGLTITAEQLGSIWTPLRERDQPQRCLALPAPQAPSTITKMAA
jgi:hypothetical protein